MMPSRAFRSVSLAIASKSTAPVGQQAARLILIQGLGENNNVGLGEKQQSLILTLISAIVEHIKGFYSLFSSLFATKDQINPLMEVAGDILGFLEVDISLMSRHV